jgi:hypothetical protein
MVTLAEIVDRYGPAYQEQYGDQMLPSHRQVLRAIVNCRTAVLGGHVYHCDACDEPVYHYHSCRNRHCPQCQHGAGQRWLAKQQQLLLPVPYFLLTFTLPDKLRSLARRQQRLMYNLLFRCAAGAIQTLAGDERQLGGQAGLIGVLHTWGRNLSYHPHVHFLAPAGGLTPDRQWRATSHNFFLPVKGLSRIFRAKLRDALRQTTLFAEVPATVWHNEWVVHCQPVGDGQTALRYLAPYIFRVALSNRRLVKVVDDRVTFRFRQSDTGAARTCTLAAPAFIHRFLQHVLPKGFVKVRYYGFFAAGQRPRFQRLRAHLTETSPTDTVEVVATASEAVAGETAADSAKKQDTFTVRCPRCQRPLTLPRRLNRQKRAPP